MKNLFLLISLFLLLSFKATAQAVPVISFQSLHTGLSSPVDIVNAADGSNRIFIVEQRGTVRIRQNGALLPQNFLNITAVTLNSGEQGFLSMAFHPDYENNRYFFVYYNNLAGAVTIARYQTDAGNPNHADSTTGVILMTIPKPFTNHNGGKLNFGVDGNLYFGTGDGGSGGDPNNYSQNGNSLLGKMIRINVDNFSTFPYYTIPASNPYVSNPAVLDEIWSLGLRNPWRWSFDKQTNDMWIADVGQGAWEEIDFRPAGATGGRNYGWRCYEGNHGYNTSGCLPQASYDSAIFEYPHNNTTGGFSVTGGYVYRGSEFSFLQGYYICADYVSGNGWLIKANETGGGFSGTIQPFITNLSSFGEAEDGTLYAVRLSGTFYKVNALNPIPLKLISFNGKNNIGTASLRWITENEHMAKAFDVEQSNDGINFTNAGTVLAKNTVVTNVYTFLQSPVATYYRLKMIDLDNKFVYSPIIKLGNAQTATAWIYPNLIPNGVLHIFPDGNLSGITVFDAMGKKILAKQFKNAGAHVEISIATFAKGIYWVRMENSGSKKIEKILVY